MNATLSRWAPQALAVLRIVAALVFLQHGLQKLVGFPPLGGPMHPLLAAGAAGQHGLPTLLVIACLIEVVAGILLLLGLFTRPVAFIASGEMAVAYLTFHLPRGGFFPAINHGETAVLLCFVFLYLVFAGGGAWSVDNARDRA